MLKQRLKDTLSSNKHLTEPEDLIRVANPEFEKKETGNIFIQMLIFALNHSMEIYYSYALWRQNKAIQKLEKIYKNCPQTVFEAPLSYYTKEVLDEIKGFFQIAA